MLADIPQWVYAILAPSMIVGWFVMLAGIAIVGGWQTLARAYPSEDQVWGSEWGGQSVGLRGWCGYNGCVRVTAAEQGLRLAVMLFVRPAHPPLFLPYAEMTIERRGRLLRQARIRMNQAPNIAIDISAKLADRIGDEIGESWPDTPSDKQAG